MDVKSARVAFLLQDLAGGGAERVMLLVCKALVERGAEVDLVVVRKEGAFVSAIPADVRVVELGARRVLQSLPALVRYLRRERPHAMLAALPHVNIVAVVAGKLAGGKTRVVISEHSVPSFTRRHATQWPIRISYRLARWIYPLADKIVVVSRGVCSDLARTCNLAPSAIRIIHNPVPVHEIDRLVSAPSPHRWFEEEIPVIVAVGRLEPVKDFSLLIHAVANVRRSQRVRLLILGDGGLRESLQETAVTAGLGNDFTMPGFVENPYCWMSRARVVAVSSRAESFSNVLVESMACGTPVVSTDCPHGPREILADGQYGRLTPVGDVQALASAIAATLQSPVDSEQLRQRAGDFSLDHAADAYGHLLMDSAT